VGGRERERKGGFCESVLKRGKRKPYERGEKLSRARPNTRGKRKRVIQLINSLEFGKGNILHNPKVRQILFIGEGGKGSDFYPKKGGVRKPSRMREGKKNEGKIHFQFWCF